jgi:ATP-dependent helicase Lhr and Lhr-like helicase
VTLSTAEDMSLPPVFARWFAGRGWHPRAHQLAMVAAGQRGAHVLLTAPTGAGKTLAGFLPSLIELAQPKTPASQTNATGLARWAHRKRKGIHTLYLSPLKALAVDIARNLETPLAEMGLPVDCETRTGDTPASRRQRQKHSPPDILLTTPEQLALLLATKEAPALFSDLACVVLDELHALVASKRGDLLALDLARLETLAPGHRSVGLSATVAEPDLLRAWLVPQDGTGRLAEHVKGPRGTDPQIAVLASEAHIPWSGHSARHTMPEVMNAIRAVGLALVFVNTRAQAEVAFQELWRLNDENLPIGLHHGSLDAGQRRRVEAAMAAGKLRAVVCTSTLDLGIDWGDVDLVIQLGAPKGTSRLTQRIGRANHRLDEPSRALLVPANRFEVLECIAAREAVGEGKLDGEGPKTGSLDVLAQHVVGSAVAAPFAADDLYTEIRRAWPYRDLPRADFDRVLSFASDGGYALKTYERFARLRRGTDGHWRIAHPMAAQRYRMNVGTIVEEPKIKIRLTKPLRGKRTGGRAGRVLGETEEWFVEQMVAGDTFLFAGQILRFEGLDEDEAIVTRAAAAADVMIPSFQGGKFPLSTYLAERVRTMVADRASHVRLPPPVEEWLSIQAYRSSLPQPGTLLVETFPRGQRHYLVCYPFDGRLCHQSLGMLLTRRLERMGSRPMGFVANEYAMAVWGLRDMSGLAMDALFDQDMLGDDLEEWLLESNLLKRQFRNCALISGLIERRLPGKEKTGRQVTFSTDLIYDVLRAHEPDHILLRAARDDAAGGLLDIGRLAQMLKRIRGRIRVEKLDRISPLAVPVMLEIGKEPVFGAANEDILSDAADATIAEAMRA